MTFDHLSVAVACFTVLVVFGWLIINDTRA